MSGPTAGRAPFSPRTECPQCGASEWRPGRIAEPEIRRCPRCQLSYRYQPIHPLEGAAWSPAELEAIDAARRSLFDDLLAGLGPSDGGVLVDVGAGSGYFIAHAAGAGWCTLGVELRQSLAGLARDLGRRVVVGDAERIPVRAGSASVVTMWDVCDQLDTPRRALAEAARVLRDDGVLWLRVRHGTVHELMRKQRWLPARLSVLPSNLYSPRSLRAALAAAGFENIRIVASPTSTGDPYASLKVGGVPWMRLAKRLWDAAARVVGRLTAGAVIISPSISVLARRGNALRCHE